MASEPRRVRLFQALIDPLTMAETLRWIEQRIEHRTVTQHVVVNVAKLVMLQQDAELREIVNSCGLINADGQGIVWAGRLLGLPIPERVAGIDLFTNLVDLAATRGYRVYFLGATQEVVETVIARCQRDHPALQVAGYRDGYFSDAEAGEVARAVRDARPDILFVAITSPRKEWFLHQYQPIMQVPFAMGVGGSFDVLAGRITRAPAWMQRCGLEWLHRLLAEPRRLWKRYLYTNAVFLGMLVRALVRGEARHANR